MRSSPIRVPMWLALAGFAGTAMTVTAQTDPTTSAPTTPAASPSNVPATAPTGTPVVPPTAVAAKFPEPIEPGPYVRQTDVTYWALKTYLRLYKDVSPGRTRFASFRYDLPFETMTIVYPLIPSTSASSIRVGDAKGTLRLGDIDVVDGSFVPAGTAVPTETFPKPPEILDHHYSGAMYHSGTKLAKFAFGEVGVPRTVTNVSFLVDLPMQTSNTEFDDSAAQRVPWPQGPWPEAAQMTFGPQQWVDFIGPETGTVRRFNEEIFSNLIKRWLNGRDPKKDFTPVVLAKTLMAGMVKDIKTDRNTENFVLLRPRDGDSRENRPIIPVANDGGYLIEFTLRGAEFAASEPGASEWDMAALGCAIFRRCGLPTRLLIGFDKREEEEKDRNKDLSPKPRAWFEFYLYDEANNTGNWVICDPYRMRKSMNQAPPIHQKWKYFGTHDEMESVLPFAMHFVPPTDVYGTKKASFWGWQVTPAYPTSVETAVTMTARKTAIPKKNSR